MDVVVFGGDLGWLKYPDDTLKKYFVEL